MKIPLESALIEQYEQLRDAEPAPHTKQISEGLSSLKEDMRSYHAEEKAKKSKDKVFQILNSLISAVVGVLISEIFEHWPEIRSFLIEFISGLFP